MRTTPSFGLSLFLGTGFAFAVVACSAGASDSDSSGDGAGGTSTDGLDPGGTGGSTIDPGIDGNDGSGGGSGAWVLPEGFTKADKGGWKLGQELISGNNGSGSSKDCGDQILGVVRDFRRGDKYRTGKDGNPDFEFFYGLSPTTGLVLPALGTDQKPVFSGTGDDGAPPQKQMTSEADFLAWYNDKPNTPADTGYGNGNRTYEIYFSFEPNGDVRTLESSAFFPLDGAGFGGEAPFTINDTEPVPEHNFHFTTEIHTKFAYKGGEVFSFQGDDDLWVFINGKLALDLGGLHPKASGSIDLDGKAAELGIAVGTEYTLDLFHAERGMPESNFRVDTSLEFTECGIVVR